MPHAFKASLIIPHHNREGMLNALLASIPDRPDVEILVIDDQSFHFPQIHVSFHHANLVCDNTLAPTAGGARNTGLDRAKGEWIVFCDSDDLIDTDVMNQLLDRLDQTQADVVLCPPTSFTYKNGVRQDSTRHLKIANTAHAMLKTQDMDRLAQCVPPWSKFIRHAHIKRHGLRFAEVPVSNDVRFNAQLAASHPTVEVWPETYYRVRDDIESLTRKRDLATLCTRVDELNAANAILRASGLSAHQAVGAGYAWACLRHHPRATPRLLWLLWSGGGHLLPRDKTRWAQWWRARGRR